MGGGRKEDSYWGKMGEQRSPGSNPHLELQYYPCQILTLPSWFMSPVSYTLYIYTDGIFPFLDGGVICTPFPYFTPLLHIHLSRLLFVTWMETRSNLRVGSKPRSGTCVFLSQSRVTQGCQNHSAGSKFSFQSTLTPSGNSAETLIVSYVRFHTIILLYQISPVFFPGLNVTQ